MSSSSFSSMISTQMLSDLGALSPLLVIGGFALLLLTLEVFMKKSWPRAFVAGVGLITATMALMINAEAFAGGGRIALEGLFYVDSFTFFFSALILIGTFLSLLVGIDQLSADGVEAQSEYYALLLCASFGAIVFISSAELITLFLGLEIMSMALYCLCGSALSRRSSAESAMKYFLLGSFSSAFLLYGMALLYGLTGSLQLTQISHAIAGVPHHAVLLLAVGLLLVGAAFKLGAVPFHFWAPDVYQGAPTAVTVYMATVIKVAAVGALLRILWGGLGSLIGEWSGAVWYIALLTMTLGNLVALHQRSLKRMLAYSSIAHAGYMCVALLLPGVEYGGGPAVLYYLVSYSFMTLGAFGVLMAVAAHSPTRDAQRYGDDISNFHGLGYTQPFLGVVMSLFMLSLAGIPPGMAGLLGKFYIFSAAIKAHYVGLVILGVLNSAVSVYYYLRVIVAMYFIEPSEPAPATVPVGVMLGGVLAACAIAVVALGVFPDSVIDLASVATQSIRH